MSQQMQQPFINTESTAKAEKQRTDMMRKGYMPDALTMFGDSIYVGDASVDELSPHDELVNVAKLLEGQRLKAEGKLDAVEALKVFSEDYKAKREVFDRVEKLREDYFMPAHRIAGASGPEAFTQYQDIQRIHDFIKVVSPMFTIEDYTAMHICNERTTQDLRVEYADQDKGLIRVQKDLGDNQKPEPVRLNYGKHQKDLFADGIAYEIGMRARKETRIDPLRDLIMQLPGAFKLAEEEKIIDVLKAMATTNTKDWTAVTGVTWTNDAVLDISSYENTVKLYGRPIIALASTALWSKYENNIGNPTNAVASDSTTQMKRVSFAKNRGIQEVWINDNLPANNAIIAAKNAFADFYHGPTIQTSYIERGVPGQNETRTMFRYNTIEVTKAAAAIRIVTP